MEIWGIDVSHYQGVVDWQAVRGAGAAFAFAKASEGTTVADPRFADNWRGIAEAGLLRGSYHYGHPGSDPETQAVFYHSQVGALGMSDLPPVLDIETSDGHPADVVIAWVLSFLNKAEALFGRKLILYTGGFWKNALGDPSVPELARRALWLACYRTEPLLPKAWTSWTFWQYTNGQFGDPGPVPGVAGACDRSRFCGSASELASFASSDSHAASGGADLRRPNAEPSASWPGCYLASPSSAALSPDVVTLWQRRMNALGFALAADGVYGPACKAACMAFQREHGLNVDGIVGPKTWSLTFST